jgi:hypothetical protein
MFSPLRLNLWVRRVVPCVLATRNPSTLFLLPRGRSRRFTPVLKDPTVAEEAEGSMAQGRCLWCESSTGGGKRSVKGVEEAAFKGAAGVEASSPSAGIRALA